MKIYLGIQGGFSQQNGAFFRTHTDLIVGGVLPGLFHVIPVGDNSVLIGVFQGKNTSIGLSLIAQDDANCGKIDMSVHKLRKKVGLRLFENISIDNFST